MMNDINNLFCNLINHSIGITDKFLYFPVPFKQKKIKEINYENDVIYLRILDNKLYFYIFEKFDYIKELNLDHRDDYISLLFANWIYNNNYYKTQFKSLCFSMFYNQIDQKYISIDELVNVYSFKYIPEEYYKLKRNEIYYNIKIISHLLYKNELNDYIRQNFENNEEKKLEQKDDFFLTSHKSFH